MTDLQDLLRELRQPSESRIVLLVVDGLGGLPLTAGGKTELEAARTPHLDRLAAEGVVGLSTPVAAGITPGSGRGHLALFGYDPLEHRIGRGVLEALGVGVEIESGDVAARGNFCTLDAEGRVLDRRAGRLPSERGAELAARLQREICVEGVDLLVAPVREHRLVVRFRGEGLGPDVSDTDPQRTGVPPLEPVAVDGASRATAEATREFLRQARGVLAGEPDANGLLLRGFSPRPELPTLPELHGLSPAVLAVYPMYRGLARLAGMRGLDAGSDLAGQMGTLRAHWSEFDFFFVHHKGADSAGEDGDFAAKVEAIEALDARIPELLRLSPDVLVVTGDHSTPSRLRSHSFHPVPVLLWAPATVRPDAVTEFGERPCSMGGLGHIRAREILALALAHAGRLKKFGA